MDCNRSIRCGVTALAAGLLLSACDDNGPVVEPTDEPPTIQLTAPNGGTAYAPGSTVEITWTATDDNGVTGVDLSYWAFGVAETSIATEQTGGSFSWTTPNQNLFAVRVKAVATDAADQTASDESDAILAIVQASDRGYVSSAVCQTCHADKWEALYNSGHPYKLNKVENAQPPTYPHSEVPAPPDGFAWSDITYVIGGYGWKARFMDANGYILVSGLTGGPTQYNLPNQPRDGLPAEWVDYQATDTEPKPYTCGGCHTTGWQTTDENGGVNQDGLEGILGTWEETGITCEQCHMPGGNHVVSLSASDITVDRSSELCGSCHFRDPNHNILASGGFIQHHEQYDELLASPHQSRACADCHDPHRGVRYGNAEAGGIVATCESCHTEITSNAHLVRLNCEDCHMARATKSARAVQMFEGDVRTHLFRIKTDPVGKDDMFFVDPASGNTFTRGYITLDFACYSCHTDPVTGEGGGRSTRTLAQLSAKATGIHN